MKRRTKKTIIIALVIFVGLPIGCLAALLAWCTFADKTNGSLVSSGVTRRYLLYVPKSYDRTRPTPLVISIHPAATWGAVERDISRWNDVADTYGFIVVYPNGSGAFFDGFTPGPHVWPGDEDLPRDVRFISDLIDKLESEYNIDPQRVYANGMSNGGNMAFLLSCELPDRIAAVGAVAAAQPAHWDCKGAKPVATVAFHGTADSLTPYQGGATPIAPMQLANIPDWTARVAERNQCASGPSETRVSASVRGSNYTHCANQADVILYTIEGGGHTWPGGKPLAEWITGNTTREIDASRIMWQFFVAHPLGTR